MTCGTFLVGLLSFYFAIKNQASKSKFSFLNKKKFSVMHLERYLDCMKIENNYKCFKKICTLFLV